MAGIGTKSRAGSSRSAPKTVAKVAKPRAEPNGRRRLVDAEIYTVAAELFSTKGYGSTSLQDIADAMGLSRPALYHYVRSKEDILAKLVEEFTESKAHILGAVIADPALDAAEKLRAMLVSTVRSIAEHPERFRLLDRCENELPEDMLRKHRAAKRVVRDSFVTVVTEGVATGRFRAVDPRTASFALIGMCTWVAWWFTPSGQADVDRIVESIADLALHTVAVSSASPVPSPSGPIEALNSIRRQIDALEVTLRR